MSGAEPVIDLVDAGKHYTKYEDQPMLLNSIFHLHPRTRRSKLWALRNCNLSIGPGESVGVMGLNGSGKSTLLQMLAGVTAPSEGSVLVRGRVAPLVQVGVGFHPELTGRENVYVNATILGLTHAQIDERFDEILDFAELSEFIDTPVKFYSSGMYVRLGFSVAIHAEPDVLLVDEVLAVGDLPFQMKCFERMQSIRETGTTMVVVSHNIHAIRRLCDRALVLRRGTVLFDGPIAEAVNRYYELIGKREDLSAEEGVIDAPTGPLEVPPLDLVDSAGAQTRQLAVGDEATFVLEVRILADIAEPWLAFVLNSASGERIYSEFSPGLLGPCRAGERIRCEVRVPARLPTGTYWAEAGLWDVLARAPLGMSRPVGFHVTGRDPVKGFVDLGAQMSARRVPAEPAAASPGRA